MNHRVTLAGQFQQGKSLIFDMIVGKVISPVGSGMRTTSENREVKLSLGGKRRSNAWTIVDTPGVNYDEEDEATAHQAYASSDLLIWITKDKQLGSADLKILSDVYRQGIPVGVLLNSSSNNENEEKQIAKVIWSQVTNSFHPIPLSSSGVLVLRPQLMPAEDVELWDKFPELFRDLSLYHQKKHKEEALKEECGIFALRSLFGISDEWDTGMAEFLHRWLEFRKGVQNWERNLLTNYSNGG